MARGRGQFERYATWTLVAAVLAVAACADPARVVLYEERHGSVAPSRTSAPQPRPPEARPPSPVARTTITPAGTPGFYTVRSGDTVYSVSQRHHVPIRGLITLNGLRAPYVLRSGQVLRLPKSRRHVVQPGDTIYGISRQYNVAVSRLVQFNGIEPPYTIVVGRVLRLPDSVTPSVAPTRVAGAQAPASKPSGAKPSPAGRASAGRSPPQAPRNTVAAVPKPPPLSNRKFLLPVRGRVLSRFGPVGRGLRNDGVNIAAPRGTPVRAAENGIVVYSGNALLGFGNMVLLRHANGFMTAYAHNESVSVGRGDTVRRGQVIATVGSTGNVASPQLHFEIRKGKRAINPAKFLPSLAAAS